MQASIHIIIRDNDFNLLTITMLVFVADELSEGFHGMSANRSAAGATFPCSFVRTHSNFLVIKPPPHVAEH